MASYVALLRGINVGGRNKVAMADLRALLSDLGHGEPLTYVQSGNAVFTSDRGDVEVMAAEIASRISADLGVSPAVLLRRADELAAVADANPFAAAAAQDPTTVHAAFLSTDPPAPGVLTLDAAEYAPEELAMGDRVVYLHLPGGIGRSRLAVEVDRRLAGIDVTIRNWRTVAKLLDLASGSGSG